MKVAYVHNLPLEYYPPASNFLDLIGRSQKTEVRVFTSRNRKQRALYENNAIKIMRSSPPNPSAAVLWRMLIALWWHLRTAFSLVVFRPSAIIYIEPHSALAVYLYYRLFRGSARLFIHHHEYYERKDYTRPGMRLPQLGSRLERSDLFQRAEWISQTNSDRLQLARGDHPDVPAGTWQVLPNYPPAAWASPPASRSPATVQAPLRLIYVGSASFEDTYIREIAQWATVHPDDIKLHICGYNVAADVWAWLEKERFANVTFDATGYVYEDLPIILSAFDVGLVLYKGNTTNFIFNVPNKVFEYLVCGLEVWYPPEMTGTCHFRETTGAPLRELDFAHLNELDPSALAPLDSIRFNSACFTAERAFAPLFEQLGLKQVAA